MHNEPMSVPAWLRQLTLHRRMMAALVLATTLAVALSGTMLFLLQERSIHNSTQDHLSRIRDELVVLAQDGVDRRTGRSFANPEALLYQHLQTHVLGHNEGAAGFLNGKARFVPRAAEIYPDQDAELIELLRPYMSGTVSQLGTASTAKTTYMYLVVPITQGKDTGALVHVVDMDVTTADLRQAMLYYSLAAAFVLAIVVGTTWPIVRRIVHPIEELRLAAESIDERDLTSRVPVRSEDDLGVLAGAFNTMLDRLERSVHAQRDLLDDVGHELRTPITVVRGHLELMDSTDPIDVEEVKELSIDELDRMSGMVNDILMLAKSAQSDFVTPVMTDIEGLTESVFTKCQALGKRQWQLESVAPIELLVDSSRLTQAWLQVASNAVKYSDENSVIRIGSALRPEGVALWVSDNGIGISEEDLPHVRSRFARGNRAHEYAQGSGLGLSIVDTILDAHNGTMRIESRLGHGTTVTMLLPLAEPN